MDQYEKVAELGKQFLQIVTGLKPSRETALARTKIEEGLHWLEAARLADHYANGGI